MNRSLRLAIGWLLLGLASASASAAPLRAGVARLDLTPPLELKASLGGYGERMNLPATGTHDRVWGKALVLTDGQRRFALVTADILAFPPPFKGAVLAQLKADDWQTDQVMLLPSHSHTSIDMAALNPSNTFGIPQIGLFHQALFDRTAARVAQVIREAAQHPVAVCVGSSQRALEGWNRNRRRGNQVTDRDLTVTRLDTDSGQPLAVLVNWTAHPTFMDAEDMMFSGDWPGHLQRTLEALIGGGVTVLFHNGAEGDQSPTPRLEAGPRWEQAERYGRELALLAWAEWQRTQPTAAPVFAFATTRIALPARCAHPDFMQTGGKEYGLNEQNVGPLLERLCPAQTHSTSLRLGDLAIVGIPGEMAAALGLQVKEAVREKLGVRHVTIGGLADEWVSYLLAPDEYAKGGYEASVSFYGAGLGPLMVEHAVAGASVLGQQQSASRGPNP